MEGKAGEDAQALTVCLLGFLLGLVGSSQEDQG